MMMAVWFDTVLMVVDGRAQGSGVRGRVCPVYTHDIQGGRPNANHAQNEGDTLEDTKWMIR